MPNRRSELNLQKKAVKNYLLTHCYQDHVQAENVNIIPSWQVYDFLLAYSVHGSKQFEYVHPNVAMMVEQGEVLTDSRGRGSFQKA